MSATAVLGDGTTARGRAASRWRRLRWVLIVVGVALVAGIAALLPGPRTSATPLGPDNPGKDGAMAVAEVLRDQGVRVDYVRSTGDALAAADADSTLLVTTDLVLSTAQVGALVDSPADLVLVDSPVLAAAATEGTLGFGYPAGEVASARHTAQCPDPDAQAAGAIRTGGVGVNGVTGRRSTTLCFPLGDGSHGYGSTEVDGRRIDLIGDSLLISNDRVTDEGNAALALRTLGRHAHLVWYVPTSGDTSAAAAPGGGVTDLLPPQAVQLGLLGLLVLLALAYWRGRRLGPVVSERLPVVVRAAETTRGRARLYRRGRAYGHAAAALRAGAADRCARRLGLPTSSSPQHLVDALARATGRDPTAIGELLYGPPPTDDPGLRSLTRHLDELESEVHHP